MMTNQQMRKEKQQKPWICPGLIRLLIIIFSLSLGAYAQCVTEFNNIKALQKLENLASRKNNLEQALAKADKSQSNKLKDQLKDLDSIIRLKQSELDKLIARLEPIKGPETLIWKVDNCYRQALVIPPAINTANGKHPLVFVFHGHNGTMQDTSEKMNIQVAWPEAIVVYPQGLETPSPSNPEGDKSGWEREKDQESPVGNRDLKLFDTMVTAMKQKFKVDDTQIFATGFSNGASFCYLLWAERGSVIAAIGEIAGGLEKSEHLAQPLPALAIVGKTDTKDVPDHQFKNIDKAKTADNVIEPGQPCEQNNNLFTCTLYRSTTRTPVKILLHPGGHEIPSWAGEQIVRFFKNHKQL